MPDDERGPVAAGTGWPGDPATATTPVALTAGDVVALAGAAGGADELDACASVCRACPRLVDWREEVARVRRAAYAGERYWGRPMPSFGPPDARVLVVGLAPAAHGGNRTGRIFTGDRSGDWLFAALYRVGLAASPTSTAAGDGQRLLDARITAAVRCAPPANKPTPAERDVCRPWLVRELELLRPRLRAIVVLGGFAWQALWPALADAGFGLPPRRPAFGHGARVELPALAGAPAGPLLLGCYHPSQQNTFTGRVTAAMLEDVLGAAARHAASGGDQDASARTVQSRSSALDPTEGS
ncbi:uracil-DNA glycosylase [Pseudofrankia inefficax]|uniref:Type-5 uracil-DNA glycosylase n=1 Tax=Pseudofrankia inefficax (strain DSM 45817 / CECT 9037 / DDB 130130 / EuI1c) TaxID=298654 RepID=E3JCN8_PSEI1|nr:uracil-DNA glycosylase [Pseudofrankia inefficax]ADP78734.1 Uracil-DNA glycosylase superfamily [Pseudofrankia inefficax]